MTNYTIIDRRINPTGKNLSNRQRFLHRVRDWVKKKVQEKAQGRQITSTTGENIIISNNDISEPVFDYNHHSGDWDRVLPGNREFITGDKIKRPKGDRKNDGTDIGNTESIDDFSFSITRDEYLSILFEDLELPNLIKESETKTLIFERKRTGFSSVGTPNNLDLEKSLKNALGRRIALAFPIDRKIKEKIEELEKAAEDDKEHIQLELADLIRRRSNIGFIDQVDVKYKRYSQVPLPQSQAVMFCLMDVSGSMGEKEKDIAKRFFLLLYLFLEKKYKNVDVKFVKHTEEANECTEEEFFHSKESGGTLVSSGIIKIHEIIKKQYPLEDWNIYVCQASDGDTTESDNKKVVEELDKLLPKCQYYVYNEVKQTSAGVFMGVVQTGESDLMKVLKNLSSIFSNFITISTPTSEKVVESFRKVFLKKRNEK